MKPTKKIAIIGNAGSGKSVLSKKLQPIFKLPVYHLDQYFWKPGWIEPDPQEYKQIHDAICNKEEWIIDGMNLRLLDYRASQADMIIFLNLPRAICFWRIFKRTYHYYGTVTPSSAPECNERVNRAYFKFLKWVWNFKNRYPNKINEILKQYSSTKKIYILKSQKEIDQFIEKIKKNDF